MPLRAAYEGPLAPIRTSCSCSLLSTLYSCLHRLLLPVSCFLFAVCCLQLAASYFLLPTSCFLLPASYSLDDMRVVAGTYRSRQLTAPRGLATRPTSDRLRETLFNVLAPRLQGARFADLYAGSGAVGIEALSRGAGFCCFAEHAPAALAAIRANLATLNIRSGFSIEPRAISRSLEQLAEAEASFDLIFLDPPYDAAGEYTATLATLDAKAKRLLAPRALVIAEHARRSPPPENFGVLTRTRLLEQGDAALSFYARSM